MPSTRSSSTHNRRDGTVVSMSDMGSEEVQESAPPEGRRGGRSTGRERSQSDTSLADGSLFNATDDNEDDSPVSSPKLDEAKPRYSLRKFGPIKGGNKRPISVSNTSEESGGESESSPPRKRGRPAPAPSGRGMHTSSSISVSGGKKPTPSRPFSVKREIMEVVITRPSKPLPPPLSIQSDTLLDDVSRLVPRKKKIAGIHHQETTHSRCDKTSGKMPIPDSSKTLPPPSIPSTSHKEDNANSASSSIPAATSSLVPVPLPSHAISLSGGGGGGGRNETTAVTDTDTPHLISYLTSRALGIIADASKDNTLTTLTPAMVLTRLEVMLNAKLGALQMTSFCNVLLKVIQSTIQATKDESKQAQLQSSKLIWNDLSSPYLASTEPPTTTTTVQAQPTTTTSHCDILPNARRGRADSLSSSAVITPSGHAPGSLLTSAPMDTTHSISSAVQVPSDAVVPSTLLHETLHPPSSSLQLKDGTTTSHSPTPSSSSVKVSALPPTAGEDSSEDTAVEIPASSSELSTDAFTQRLLEQSRCKHAELLAHLQTIQTNAHRDSERLEKLYREMQAMREETRKSMEEIQESVRKIQETQWRAVQIKTEDEEEASASIPDIPQAPSPIPRAPSPAPTCDVQIGPMRWPADIGDMNVSVEKLVRMVFPRAPQFEAHFAVCEDEERETGEADRLHVIVGWKEERDAIRFVNSWNTNTPEKYRGSRLTVEKLF